jgi:hypothetical protein
VIGDFLIDADAVRPAGVGAAPVDEVAFQQLLTGEQATHAALVRSAGSAARDLQVEVFQDREPISVGGERLVDLVQHEVGFAARSRPPRVVHEAVRRVHRDEPLRKGLGSAVGTQRGQKRQREQRAASAAQKSPSAEPSHVHGVPLVMAGR